MQCALVRGHRTNFGFGARLVAIRECFAELPDDPDRDAKLATLVVFTGWIEHDADGWIAVAREAETALPVHGAEALAVAALENALHGRACGKRTVAAVSAAATRLAAHDRHESSLDPRLTALRAMSCSK
jgi:hypothetical protein